MLNSAPSLPWMSEYTVLAFGDPNSSLSVTLSLATSAPTAFSGTDAELWRGRRKKGESTDSREGNAGIRTTYERGGEQGGVVVAVEDGDDGGAGGRQPLPLRVGRFDDQFVFRLSLNGPKERGVLIPDWECWYSQCVTSLSSPDAFTPIIPLTGFTSNTSPSLVSGS